MRVHRFSSAVACAVAALSGFVPTHGPLAGQDIGDYALEARVWLDRDPTLQMGDRVRIYYRVDQDAYVAIFHIDSNGTARMVFPSSPQEAHFARGGRDYRVLFPGSSFWLVDDDPGVGYFFIVASPEPFDFRQFGYTHYSGGWDLTQAGSQVYQDPYLAMDDYVAALLPDWEYVPYALDFTEYQVDGHYDYPRFLCYDCHTYQPYYSWNPYLYTCTSYRVVIYSYPYFYPTSRYLGTRVVYAQPLRGVAHYGVEDRALGEPGTPRVVVRDTPPVSQPGVAGGETRRAVPRSGSGSSASPGGAAGNRSAGSGREQPGVAGASPRRTLGSTSGSSTAPSTISTPPTTGTSGRPVLERRSPTGGSATTTPRVTTPPRGSGARTSGISSGPPGDGTAVRLTVRSPSGSRTTTRSTVQSSGGSGTTTRPTVRSTGRSSTTARPTVRSSGGSTTMTRPTVRSTGRSSTTTRPTVRSSGGFTTTTRPTVRSTGRSSTTARPTVRSSGRSTTTTRPTVRSTGGSSTTTRPTVRSSGGSTTTTRPTVRSSGGSTTTTRPTVRSSGGSTTTTRPKVRTGLRKPPPRRPGGGG